MILGFFKPTRPFFSRLWLAIESDDKRQNLYGKEATSFDQSCSLLVSLFLLQTDVSNVQTWTVLSRFDPRKPLKTAPQNISYRSAGLKQLQIRCETRLKTCGISPGKNASLNKSLIHITNRTHLLRPIM